MTTNDRWIITAPGTGWILASGPTELQAWLRLLEWDGTAFEGEKFFDAVRHFRASGHEAREITDDMQEAYDAEGIL